MRGRAGEAEAKGAAASKVAEFWETVHALQEAAARPQEMEVSPPKIAAWRSRMAVPGMRKPPSHTAPDLDVDMDSIMAAHQDAPRWTPVPS